MARNNCQCRFLFFVLVGCLLLACPIAIARTPTSSGWDFYVSEMELVPPKPVVGENVRLIVTVQNNSHRKEYKSAGNWVGTAVVKVELRVSNNGAAGLVFEEEKKVFDIVNGSRKEADFTHTITEPGTYTAEIEIANPPKDHVFDRKTRTFEVEGTGFLSEVLNSPGYLSISIIATVITIIGALLAIKRFIMLRG